MTSTSTWPAEKIAIPSTRRSACSEEERAAPIFAASNGSVGRAVSLLRSSITHLWNFITAPCRGRFCTSSVESPKRLRHDPVPVLLGPGQLGKQPLAAIHDELKILNDRRLAGEYPR